MQSAVYLGHVIGGGEVKPDADKIQAVEACSEPRTKKEVRAFLGLTGYYRKFIPNYAGIARPPTALLKKSESRGEAIEWSEECAAQ